jgi:hypothetical protein
VVIGLEPEDMQALERHVSLKPGCDTTGRVLDLDVLARRGPDLKQNIAEAGHLSS